MKTTQLQDLIPGIFFAIVLMLLFIAPSVISNFAPRYYAGDPNFNVEESKSMAIESYQQSHPFALENKYVNNLILPPKVLSNQTRILVSVIQTFTLYWTLCWSVYAFMHRKNFPSKNVVWITSAFYLAYRAIFTLILLWAAAGLESNW